jgi:hypothetical protein
MKGIRAAVVATLLGVWCFPMVSSAKVLSSKPAPAAALIARPTTSEASDPRGATAANASEAASLATREQQSRDLQDFKGGGVTIYIGSGVLLILLIILLIILI